MIGFTRDGRYVMLQGGDALSVVELDNDGAERSLPCPGLRDFAAFDDEMWVVAGTPPVLRRHSPGGAQLGRELPLPEGEALLARVVEGLRVF